MFRIAIITAFLFYTSIAFAKTNLTLDLQQSQLLGEIRCITCGGQTVLESHSEFAHLIRKFVEMQLRDGKSIQQIKDQLIEIYGEDIILTPKFNYTTAALWLAPLLFLSILGVYGRRIFYK